MLFSVSPRGLLGIGRDIEHTTHPTDQTGDSEAVFQAQRILQPIMANDPGELLPTK